jgi:hypothetical protein
VEVDGALIDVETTNPYGFNPGTKKEFKDVFGKVTGYSYVPPSNYSDRRPIGEKELLSLILSNRVSGLTDRSAFREALPVASSAHALVRSRESLLALLSASSNYAAWLGSRGDFERARAFVDGVEAAYGADRGLDDRRLQLFHNQVISLIEGGSLEEARRLLGQRDSETPLDAGDWMELSEYLVQREAELAASSRGYPAAAELIADALGRLGRQQELLMAYEAYVHNQFATLYNARRFGEARSVILSGLSVYAESRVLRQDKGIVEKELRQ